MANRKGDCAGSASGTRSVGKVGKIRVEGRQNRETNEIEKEKKRGREWIKELIKNKLRVECEVREVKRSEPVIVAKIEGEEGKKEIMKNKFKLKEERMFIENDLTYEERKVQEKMGRWTREKKAGGIEMKVGRGRLKIGSRWVTWEEIERERREGGKREGEEIKRGWERRIEILFRPRRERKSGERERDKGKRMGRKKYCFGTWRVGKKR